MSNKQIGAEIRYKKAGRAGLYWGFVREYDGDFANITLTDIDGRMLWKPLRRRVKTKNLRFI
jgi:hypothetical protein